MTAFLEALRHFHLWGAPAWQWLGLIVLVPTALSLGWVLGGVILVVLRALAKRTVATWDDQMVRLMAGPIRLCAAAVIFRVGLLLLSARGAPAELGHALAGASSAAAAAAFGWKLVDFVVGLIEARATHDGADPMAGRGLRTQAKVIGQILHVVVFLVGVALVLVQFDVLRSLGVSLLASAGVAGIVLGIAAQRSIGTLLAGVQLSITRPVRLGDQIVIEGEFGTVEEMTLSYAVVKLWDQRRLVVPITRFLEQPFQNWTRMTPELIGVVLMQVDYSAPIELIRQEALAYIAGNTHWNGGTSELRVTEAGERTITLRILASANDATRTGELRCDIREHMIVFLQSLDGGAYLPKERFAASEDARPRGRDDDDDPEIKLKN